MSATLYTFPDGACHGPLTPPLAQAARAAGEPGSPTGAAPTRAMESAGRWQGRKVRVLGSGLEGHVVGRRPADGQLLVQHRGVRRPYAPGTLEPLEGA